MTSPGALLDLARAQLAANRRSGVSTAAGGLRYDFVCPSISHYPFQWFWDSCFHAIVLTRIDQALAEQELLCLLQGAFPDGFIPHMLLWERSAFPEVIAGYNLPRGDAWRTATMQTPVLGIALRRVCESGRSTAFLDRVLPPAVRYYDWLAGHRDPDADGLISILQPDESGLDSSPKYDAELGLMGAGEPEFRQTMDRLFAAYAPREPGGLPEPSFDAFQVEDVMVNSVYAESLRDLAAVCRDAGEHAAAERFTARAEQTEHALLTKCWDAERGVFWDLDGADERPARVLTITSLFPLILERMPRPVVEALVRCLTDPATLWSRYPVPSVAMNEPSYDPNEGLLWRGPTWLNANWFLVRGLRRHGFDAIADAIAAASRELVLRHGFREYFHPQTGAPGGTVGFGWSTLVVDM